MRREATAFGAVFYYLGPSYAGLIPHSEGSPEVRQIAAYRRFIPVGHCYDKRLRGNHTESPVHTVASTFPVLPGQVKIRNCGPMQSAHVLTRTSRLIYLYVFKSQKARLLYAQTKVRW